MNPRPEAYESPALPLSYPAPPCPILLREGPSVKGRAEARRMRNWEFGSAFAEPTPPKQLRLRRLEATADKIRNERQRPRPRALVRRAPWAFPLTISD